MQTTANISTTLSVSQMEKLIALCKKYRLAGWDAVTKYDTKTLCQKYNGAGPDAWHPAFRAVATQFLRLFRPCVLVHDVQFSQSDGTDQGFQNAVDCWKVNGKAILDKEYPLASWKMLRASYRMQRARWWLVMEIGNAGISCQAAKQAWRDACSRYQPKAEQ